MNLPTRDPSEGSAIADAGGWISGSMGTETKLTGFNPAALVVQVRRLLEKRGFDAVVPPGGLNTAIIAAADLLRALGVEPQSVPEVTE